MATQKCFLTCDEVEKSGKIPLRLGPTNLFVEVLVASGITTGRTLDMLSYRSLSTTRTLVLQRYSVSFSRMFSSLAPSPELLASESSPKLDHNLQSTSVPILDPQGRVC